MDHWRQPDKGGQQQQKPLQQPQQLQQTYQQHKYQAKSTPNTEQPILNPIQSIANVLNQHSKFVKNQKKSQQLEEQERDKNKLEQHQQQQQQQLRSSLTSDDHLQQQNNGIALSPSSYDTSNSPVAHTFSQVDQGNSYLYAYNDIVTSNRPLNKDHFSNSTNYQGISASKLRKNNTDNSVNEIHTSLCNHLPSVSNLTTSFNQETLIDSDEDDALSYILHQHRAPDSDLLHEIRCLNFSKASEKPPSDQQQQRAPSRFLPQYEDNGPNSFDAQRIDHHLSCSRRSHPRHICGIGGSQNDKLNHIAARLREESQRAFVLNQRPRNSYTESIISPHRKQLSNDFAAIQAQQFTHDLKIIHNQLATGQLGATQHEFNEELEKGSSNDSDLSNDLHLTSSGAIENSVTIGSQAHLLNSESKIGLTSSTELVSGTDNRSSNLLPQDSECNRFRQRENRGYLSWLFCCLCNLFGVDSSSSQTAIKQQHLQNNLAHSNFAALNPSSNVCRRGRGGRQKRESKRDTHNKLTNESSIVSMYSSSQQVAGVGQLGGQAGAYYATQTPQTDTSTMHHYTNHAHHSHHHHYPLSSDSSLGSSAFANSALRMNNFFRSCCSKKCLFIFCLLLIMFIFIFVIGISVYLNFLINSNKTNLIPLSGRLKVQTQGDTFSDQLMNRTSKEFLIKQQQYETILRGAFDRTQNLLKSYPNHLVKSEVYSFKQGSLWVYFRLFINKRTILLDTQLMKRKSPDEHFDKQFLPRLTQQTLHSGFEQLITTFNKESPPLSNERRSSRSSQSAELRHTRGGLPEQQARISLTQRDHVKSFDDQISRLMPLIESIDLQSIQVTPEFDMLQSVGNSLAAHQQSMSENLRASQFLTTTSSAVMVATGSSGKTAAEYDVSQPTNDISPMPSSPSPLPFVPSSSPKSTSEADILLQPSTQSAPDEINVTTKKFTLFDYKENATRPTTSTRPALIQQTNSRNNHTSTFLVNHQRKPATSTEQTLGNRPSQSVTQSNTLREIVASRPTVELSSSSPPLPVDTNKDQVRLISGQPVVSQNSFQRANNQLGRSNFDERSTSANKTSIPLFAPLSKLDQSSPQSNLSPLASNVHSDKNNLLHRDKGVNETVVMQMVAPYQKIEFSTRPLESTGTESSISNRAKPVTLQDTSIQELWNNALGNSNKKNATNKSQTDYRPEAIEQSGNQKRLITVTTIGGGGGGGNNQELSTSNSTSHLDWSKISSLSADNLSNNRTLLGAPSISTSQTTTTSLSVSSQKPKVSPPFRHAGSIVSSTLTSSPRQQQEPPTSAVVLNRDFQQVNNEGQSPGAIGVSNSTQQQQMSTIRSTQSPRPEKQHHQQQRRPTTSSVQRNNTAGSDAQKQRFTKPIIKQQKAKKVLVDGLQQAASKNETTTTGTLINSKGIRIVDNFTASLDATSLNKLAQSLNASNSLMSAGARQNKTKTQEAFNFNADHLAPTLPTTIELTRSTSAFPSRTTEPRPKEADSFNDQRAASNVDYTTTSSVSQKSTTPISVVVVTPTAGPATFVSPTLSVVSISNNGNQVQRASSTPQTIDRQNAFANQQAIINNNQLIRPGTTSFSNQWKPIANNSNEDSSWTRQNNTTSSTTTTTTKQPNLSLIIGTERLPPTINVPSNQGSQSPFAMSTAILENQLKPASNNHKHHQHIDSPLNGVSRRINKLSNTYHVVSVGSNEFESHRMSRMRQQGASPAASNIVGTSQSLSTSTLSSLNQDVNTRFVDDFMITTDRIDGNTRGSTILPPLVLSSLHHVDQMPKIRAANPADIQPKRTRGPFAFETLKAIATESTSTLRDIALADLDDEALTLSNQGRSERSPVKQGADQKLLVRKKLFLDSGDDDELKPSPSTSPSSVTLSDFDSADKTIILNQPGDTDGELDLSSAAQQPDRFGNRKPVNSSRRLMSQAYQKQVLLNDGNNSGNFSFRCPYYGCKAKGSLKLTCLNYTQICDDFIDCQDESDELDCVSLLKHDSKSNKLSFSNGGGIIYLNRKGSLAPMCIDYFGSTETPSLTSSLLPSSSSSSSSVGNHDLDPIQLDAFKKQQELIKQINTIGQYACSLQSFSRLVSVKINHHNLVDGLDLIKTSKLYHRLSIVSDLDKHDKSLDTSFGSYRSGTSNHEVEISTSQDCPSQRTVFVKCGSFECGQDSFSIIDQNNNASKKKGGVIINDFPWLVKLYWLGSLSCHGYLIDELWLISSRECFANKTQTDGDKSGWTAEISYEHYGNDDYQSIESNRRNIKDILVQQPDDSTYQTFGSSSIVLAKFEKPVRFSPLNRPICLPLSAMNKTDSELDRTYKDCVTATLPHSSSSPPTQDLLLSKVKFHNSIDCLSGETSSSRLDDLICVTELSRNDDGSRIRDIDDDSTRVLICSTNRPSRSRSKWIVVGVQNKGRGLQLDANKQLFTSVSSQIDWIVDTMNPKSYPNLLYPEAGNSSGGNELNLLSNSTSQNQTCNQFKCSSGECLSWSRICDGLYDCSSHDDEKDCHK